jgi:hypothetical protein
MATPKTRDPKNGGAQASINRWGGEPQQTREVPVLEDEPGDAEGAGDGQGGDEHSGGGELRGTERDQQQDEADPRHQAEHEWRVRSQGLLEVVVLPRSVITYCDGGVYAAFALFALYVMGHENAALYDASWMEWGADLRRPVETGPSSATDDRDQPKEPRRQ